jgi:prepilin-type N-terminal cleavage/methylation domain-containing protein
MAKSRKAFTIIEVVLVLAVAGLLFVMVFIAFPALRNAQQRVQRQDDLSRITALSITYRADHGNLSPFVGADAADDFIVKYVDEQCSDRSGSDSILKYGTCGKDFSDPDGAPYGFDLRGSLSGQVDDVVEVMGDIESDKNEHFIIVYENAACSGEEKHIKKTNSKIDVALTYINEAGIAVCYDNQ